MKTIFAFLIFLPALAFAEIEDNSFLLEEAFNQEWGVYQFIQKYQTFNKAGTYDYAFENEIPITDKEFQFSYEIPVAQPEKGRPGYMGDMSLNLRWQPLNKDGFLLAERFGLIVPTGNAKEDSGNNVYGFEFMQAATLTINEKWMNHWNFGFSVQPNARTNNITKRRTITTATAGSSLIYRMREDFNLMFEALLETAQEVDAAGNKTPATYLTLNPGFRWAWDFEWKETQIVPGVSFPTEVINNTVENGVLVYLSIEPKFY